MRQVTRWNMAVGLGMALAMGAGCSGETAAPTGTGDGSLATPSAGVGGSSNTPNATPASNSQAGGNSVAAPAASGPAVTGPDQQGDIANPSGPTQNTPDVVVTPEAPAPGVAAVPCAVDRVVKSNCGNCHGETPIGGAMKLTTHADWHLMSPVYDKTKKVYEVAQIRINDGTMPQGGQLAEPDLATLDTWLAGGALKATADEMTCGAEPEQPTTPVDDGKAYGDNCDKPGAFDPLVAREGEECWDFKVHAPGSFDNKFSIQTGESYHEWYYDIPWPADHVATRFGNKLDNTPVLHHWLLFHSHASRRHGDVVQNVLGTTLGTNAQLLAGWAVGGCTQENPEGVGLHLPPPSDGIIMVQWHLYNTTGSRTEDGSSAQVCTMPKSSVDHVASITFLGTENFNSIVGMPPGENHFTTECRNNSGGPITIINWTPHMHTIGKNMKTVLRRADGSEETLFDEPFQFDYQVGYTVRPPYPVVAPGDTLVTTCSFFNDKPFNVGFGESTDTEMCYQFTASYPAGALDNGTISLIGATNTCW